MRGKAKRILESWSKEILIEIILDGMPEQEMSQFVKDNE